MTQKYSKMILFITYIALAVISSPISCDGPEENSELFEGDMIFSPLQLLQLKQGGINPNIPLAALKTRPWPNTIPYAIEPKLAKIQSAVNAIKEAIGEYEKKTCVRFGKRRMEKDYIYFYQGKGCTSYVGHGFGRTMVSLASGCWSKGIVMHELGHALGFYHEQSRPDRDNYVKINTENIKKGHKGDFKRLPAGMIDSLGFDYDFDSIMHYGGRYFSMNGKLTIETRNPQNQNRIGQMQRLSSGDIQQINNLFQCKTVTICKGSSNKTDCGHFKKMQISKVFYGYSSATDHLEYRQQCGDNKAKYVRCSSALAAAAVRRSCEGKRSCTLNANLNILGKTTFRNGRTCDYFPLYLTVNYRCL